MNLEIAEEERQQRLDLVLGGYFEAQARGEAPSLAELQAYHPDLAAELQTFFADRASLDRRVAPLRLAVQTVFADMRCAPDAAAFADYVLLEQIGQGGMGVVYRAKQRSLDRLVAFKMIRFGPLATPAEIQRFRDEAQTVAALDHPHIVPIYEIGEVNGQHFFSMKLLEGGSLSTSGRLPGAGESQLTHLQWAADLLVTVARAVHYAHQRGVLHRDLKPSNILLDKDGRACVADFGLAKRLAADVSLTLTGAPLGTPSYMAPEQASAATSAGPLSVTTATDVYGLGTVLYVLLTGQPPFRGDSALDVLTQVREREPARPRSLNPAVDRDLETICLKCLDKEPTKRYGSADELAQDLERWRRGEPIHARPVRRRERCWRWCRRNPLIAGLTAATVLLVLCTMATLAVSIPWIVSERNVALEERDAADKERDRVRQRERDLRRRLYASDMKLAQQAWRFGNNKRLKETLARHLPQSEHEDVRGFEWHYLWGLLHSVCRTLDDHQGQVRTALRSCATLRPAPYEPPCEGTRAM